MLKILSIFLTIILLTLCITPVGTLHKDNTIYIEDQIISENPKYIVEIIKIDPKFTDIEKQLIFDAANEWEKATNNIAKFILINSGNYTGDLKFNNNGTTIVNILTIKPLNENDGPVIFLDFSLQEEIVGYYDDGNNIIDFNKTTIAIVRNRISSTKEYKDVVMHELGHSIGLRHSENELSLMTPVIHDDDMCITQDDLINFCSIYNCNAEELNSCNRDIDNLICY